MDVFELSAKIKMDTSEYDKGLNQSKKSLQQYNSDVMKLAQTYKKQGMSMAEAMKKAHSEIDRSQYETSESAKKHSKTFSDSWNGAFDKIKSGLATAAKVGAAAIGAVTAAATAFAGVSVKTGMQFDSSMSQVAATMGTTVDKIGELRDFAMDMGAKTAFSATQAADALNYMALAGYDANEAMQALPNVLNLAAAGGIDLAYASDMVTDAQSALGLTMEESADLVDKMAMASSKSNTSVSQLGEAILTVGGTAKNLAGGTTEMATALGILADNGVKGAEGGTALRNIILSLGAPTDKAADALEALGVQVYDTEGKMRPLNDTFGDLNSVLSTMTQGEQTQVLNEIFNKVDLKSVNALLANTGERFDELSAYIDNAAGSAENMANTQLDNLAGDITLFKSALEGAQIVLSDQLTPSLRDFVQLGTTSIQELSDAFKDGGLEGMMEALNGVLAQWIEKLVTFAPQLVEVGVDLINALIDGVAPNAPAIAEGALEIVKTLIDGLTVALPNLVSAAAQVIVSLAEGLAEALPDLIPAAVDAVVLVVETLIDNLPLLLDAGKELVFGLWEGIFNALPGLIAELPQIITGIVNFFASMYPTMIETWTQLFLMLVGALPDIIDGIVSVLPQIIAAIVTALIGAVPAIIEAGITLLTALVGALPDIILKIVEAIPQIIDGIYTAILDAVPDIIDAGVELLTSLITNMPQITVQVVAAIPQIIAGLLAALVNSHLRIAQAGVELLEQLVAKLPQAISTIVGKIPEIISGIVSKVRNGWNDLKNAGQYLIEGLGQGIVSAAQSIYSRVSSIIGNIKSLFTGARGFDTHSPSKWSEKVFENVMKGAEIGLQDGTGALVRSAGTAVDRVKDGLRAGVAPSGYSGYGGAPITVQVTVEGGAIASNADAEAIGRIIGERAARQIRYKGGIAYA